MASGVFFIGYVLSQMPGGYLAQVWSAKRVIFWSLIFWGAAATLCGLSHSIYELLIYRFLLGLGEGGVWPATVVLLANWFAPHERARANGYWVLCQPAAIIISSPISGWLLDHYDWRMMFIVQGLLPVAIALMWWWAVEDRPSEAKWSREEDASYFKKQEPKLKRDVSADFAFLTDRNVMLFMISNIMFSCGAYGVLMWLPSAIKTLGARNNLIIGVLTALPYVFAGFAAVYNSRRSDRDHERLWHTAAPCLAAGAALALGFYISSIIPALGLSLLCVTGAGIYASLGPKWALMTEILPKRSAGMALGLINGFGNIGPKGRTNAVGALRDNTGSFAAGFMFLSVCLALSGVLVLFLRLGSTAQRSNA